MRFRKLTIMVCAGTVLLCVAMIPVFLGLGSVSFEPNPVPSALWWVLGLACATLCVAAIGPRVSG